VCVAAVIHSANAQREFLDDPRSEPYDVSSSATINYYLPGSTDWGEEYGGRPTALWLPKLK